MGNIPAQLHRGKSSVCVIVIAMCAARTLIGIIVMIAAGVITGGTVTVTFIIMAHTDTTGGTATGAISISILDLARFTMAT